MTLVSDRVVRFVLKPLVFLAALYPIGWLAWAIYTGSFSADPLADITALTGDSALRFLCLALAVTPLRRVSGWNAAIKFRRMLGLFAFFYGTLHFLIYLIADRLAGLDLSNGIVTWSTARGLAAAVGADLSKRRFITMGFTAWMCMLPLALTSTAGSIRRLGGRRWNRLHRLVYAAAIAGVVHFYWLVKSDVRRPLAYGALVAVLLGFRLLWRMRSRAAPAVARAPGVS